MRPATTAQSTPVCVVDSASRIPASRHHRSSGIGASETVRTVAETTLHSASSTDVARYPRSPFQSSPGSSGSQQASYDSNTAAGATEVTGLPAVPSSARLLRDPTRDERNLKERVRWRRITKEFHLLRKVLPCLDFEELSQRSTLKRASRYIAFLEECLLRDDGMYDEETAAMVCRDEVNDNVMADDGTIQPFSLAVRQRNERRRNGEDPRGFHIIVPNPSTSNSGNALAESCALEPAQSNLNHGFPAVPARVRFRFRTDYKVDGEDVVRGSSTRSGNSDTCSPYAHSGAMVHGQDPLARDCVVSAGDSPRSGHVIMNCAVPGNHPRNGPDGESSVHRGQRAIFITSVPQPPPLTSHPPSRKHQPPAQYTETASSASGHTIHATPHFHVTSSHQAHLAVSATPTSVRSTAPSATDVNTRRMRTPTLMTSAERSTVSRHTTVKVEHVHPSSTSSPPSLMPVRRSQTRASPYCRHPLPLTDFRVLSDFARRNPWREFSQALVAGRSSQELQAVFDSAYQSVVRLCGPTAQPAPSVRVTHPPTPVSSQRVESRPHSTQLRASSRQQRRQRDRTTTTARAEEDHRLRRCSSREAQANVHSQSRRDSTPGSSADEAAQQGHGSRSPSVHVASSALQVQASTGEAQLAPVHLAPGQVPAAPGQVPTVPGQVPTGVAQSVAVPQQLMYYQVVSQPGQPVQMMPVCAPPILPPAQFHQQQPQYIVPANHVQYLVHPVPGPGATRAVQPATPTP
ncbi:uncharacterized protein LOC135821211 [Sycon ciliatum]|uniref:uncharacterized protein LOC135821211 n=1 Tax=Sycon ciliatum TaxID=27933 RepID=UPI0020ABC5D9